MKRTLIYYNIHTNELLLKIEPSYSYFDSTGIHPVKGPIPNWILEMGYPEVGLFYIGVL